MPDVVYPTWQTTLVTDSIASNSFYLIVAQITHNAAGDDTISAWTFANNANVPTTIAGLGSATVTQTGNFWNANDISNAYVMFRGSTGSLDAIRVSNLSGEAGLTEVLTAIPEPGTAALVLLGVGAALLGRRLRKLG